MTTRWIQGAVEILTVGLPFCAFKLVTGLIALDTAFAPLGYALLALGTVDLVFNALNLVALVAAHRRLTGACLAELVLRGRHDLALALDVFLSFSLVAAVVGLGLIVRIPAWAMPIWNFAVVLNVLGAGIGRLFSAVRRPA
ncbi:MAG TPA: hypothetical protein VF403_12295 [Kofleriaceae bacterium]